MSDTLLRRTKIKKARNNYRCLWCDEMILKGYSYVDLVGIYDYQFQNGKFHPECEAILDVACGKDGFWPDDGDRIRGGTKDEYSPI